MRLFLLVNHSSIDVGGEEDEKRENGCPCGISNRVGRGLRGGAELWGKRRHVSVRGYCILEDMKRTEDSFRVLADCILGRKLAD